MEKFNAYKAQLDSNVAESLGYVGITLNNFETTTKEEASLAVLKYHYKNGTIASFASSVFGDKEIDYSAEDLIELKKQI